MDNDFEDDFELQPIELKLRMLRSELGTLNSDLKMLAVRRDNVQVEIRRLEELREKLQRRCRIHRVK